MSIKVSETERERIERAARVQGLQPATFVRAAVLAASLPLVSAMRDEDEVADDVG